MYTFIKRCFDIILSLIGLVLAIILCVILYFVCLFSRNADCKGPLFYNAARVGLNGKQFIMYKFRTMQVDAPDLVEPDGSTLNSANDARLTKIGKWLRNTSLDELPQVLNVLKGEMSIVGPRPDLQREADLYVDDEAAKLLVKPGITGYAQVYGRNAIPWRERLKLDSYYVKHRSLRLDAKILLRSFIVVFKQEGIYVK